MHARVDYSNTSDSGPCHLPKETPLKACVGIPPSSDVRDYSPRMHPTCPLKNPALRCGTPPHTPNRRPTPRGSLPDTRIFGKVSPGVALHPKNDRVPKSNGAWGDQIGASSSHTQTGRRILLSLRSTSLLPSPQKATLACVPNAPFSNVGGCSQSMAPIFIERSKRLSTFGH
jgi:hypothetical protein